MEIHWLLPAFITACAAATQDAWVKKYFGHLTPYEMAVYPYIYSIPLFGIAFAFVERPPLDATFWLCLSASLPLDGIALLLYMEAIRVSPLSLTVPYLAFSPLIIMITGRLFLHETPSLAGAVGVLVTVAGTYVLNLNPARQSLLAPFKAMAQERGTRLMFLVALLFSFSSICGKNAIVHSSPLFFALFFILSFSVLLTLILIMLKKISLQSFLRYPGPGAVGGLLLFIHAISHNMAIAMTQVAYMISVKRLSILVSVIYGGIWFRERQVLSRMIGALLMVAGTVIISLWAG